MKYPIFIINNSTASKQHITPITKSPAAVKYPQLYFLNGYADAEGKLAQPDLLPN